MIPTRSIAMLNASEEPTARNRFAFLRAAYSAERLESFSQMAI